jgi:hypothetical protein
MVDAELRQREGRLETVALDEEGVGDEAEQVRGVPDTTVPEVLERLGYRTRRGGREGRELRVGLGLTAECEQGYAELPAPAPELLEALRPCPPPPEEAWGWRSEPRGSPPAGAR